MRSSRSRCPSCPIGDLRIKLSRVVSQHEQLKIAFDHLKSQISNGLLEAEDVFASLAIPLIRLVGSKTVEMAEEGRFSSIIVNDNNSSYTYSTDWRENEIRSDEASGRPMLETEEADEYHRLRKLEMQEEDMMAKATEAGKELMRGQKLKLMQLVHLLKKTEIQVNSSEDDILQTLADHRVSIQKFLQQAVTYVSAIDQSCQTNVMSFITLKLLKGMFDRVGSALGAVEIGVEDLMAKLADRMCNPMVMYVNDLKAEMIAGTCPSLLATMEEMGGAMRLRRLELEEAIKKSRAAENSRLAMLTKLKESEERMRKMGEQQGFLLEAKGSKRHSHPEKLLEGEKDQSKNGMALWELQRKKRKLLTPDSPFGPKELLGIGTTEGNLKSSRVRPSIRSRSHSISLSPRTPIMDFWVPLGSSPSAATQQVLSRKRITP